MLRLNDSLVYVVKDLVPDMTLFYKQYKSIQPWLQNENAPEKGNHKPSHLVAFEIQNETQESSFNHLKTARSLTECTSVSSALAARLRARPTGGTKMNILVRLR